MNIDDPAVSNVLRRSMIARLATLSRTGRPSINPLYFVYVDDHLWLSTAEWTLAARNVKADPRVSVLFKVEQGHAISGERRLPDFFERVAPFEMAFMALFGRRELPHRSRTLAVSWPMWIVPV